MNHHIPIVYEEEKPISWKYRRIDRNLEKDAPLTGKELDEMGMQGWRLCGILSSGSYAYFYFIAWDPKSNDSKG